MTWGTTTLMDWLGQALCCQRPARSAGSVSGESAESVEDQFQSQDSKQRVVVRGEPMASSFENLPSPALSPALSPARSTVSSSESQPAREIVVMRAQHINFDKIVF